MSLTAPAAGLSSLMALGGGTQNYLVVSLNECSRNQSCGDQGDRTESQKEGSTERTEL